MTRDKKIPIRKCVVTGAMRPKKEMVRIVRSKDGEVSIDPSGKKPGRGAYLSKDKDVINNAKKKNTLASLFRVEIAEHFYDELLLFVEREKL